MTKRLFGILIFFLLAPVFTFAQQKVTIYWQGSGSFKIYRATSSAGPFTNIVYLPSATQCPTSPTAGTNCYVDDRTGNPGTYYYHVSTVTGSTETAGPDLAVVVPNVSGGTTTTPVSVQVGPLSVNLNVSQSEQLTATVAGTTNTAVTWAMNPQVGTLSSSGLYTAPSSIAAAQTITVTATSQADTTKSAQALINLVPVTVQVNPSSVNLVASQTEQLTATVAGTTNTAVTWTMSPLVGTLSSSGFYTAPSSIAAAQTIIVTATSQADTTKSAQASLNLAQTLPTAGNTATFVGVDTTTQGNWMGTYGKDGYVLARIMQQLPSYLGFTLGSHNEWTWAVNTADPRALEVPGLGSGGHSAQDWETAQTPNAFFTFSLTFNDGQAHPVEIYCVDWDTYGAPAGRVQTIQVLDTASGAVLSSQSMANFVNGQWLKFKVSGNVTFKVINNNSNAVVSGVFFN